VRDAVPSEIDSLVEAGSMAEREIHYSETAAAKPEQAGLDVPVMCKDQTSDVWTSSDRSLTTCAACLGALAFEPPWSQIVNCRSCAGRGLDDRNNNCPACGGAGERASGRLRGSLTLQITNFLNDTKQVLGTSDDQVELQLRRMFPGATELVPYGCLGNVVQAVGRIGHIGVLVLDGTIPPLLDPRG
jgi:hypothetical protein